MTEREWLSTEDWYASLPSVYVAAGGLITDAAGRVLLVKPNYRPYWLFPGGIVEDGEAPHLGCEREVLEEVGLNLAAGRLLVADWVPADGTRPRPSLYFLFDCGTYDEDTPIRLQEEELDDHAFVTVEEGAGMLAATAAIRLRAALDARRTGETRYLPATRSADAEITG
ncbi:NUDIX hydrolase [Actinoallomurus purpureus]|uniref:NUDIX domain-containing protein n=1 Tax=Actinoallomurus purpureus TaxID=478114 RepID=UPI002092C991|nr:NUDIX hydrolase [Actinoallomurus purpureus]MCO6009572.1 NUDIX hydrolase [Actinoallomurus purpureus]